ncbi:MAG: hypothetical protein OHK0022_51970 [Roseiflexaceae bacterium]
MSQRLVLGVCSLVVAGMFLLAYTAQQSTYQRFAEGAPLTATVIGIYENGAVLAYTGEDGEEVRGIGSEYESEAQLAQLRIGDRVEILQMSGIPARVTLRDSLDQARPNGSLLPLSTVFLLVGLLLVWPRPPKPVPMTSSELVSRSLRNTRIASFWGGLLLTGMALLLSWVQLTGQDTTSNLGLVGAAALLVICAVMLAVGLFLLAQVWSLRNIGGSRLFKLLAEQPEQVVWAYEQVAKMRYGGRQSVVVIWFSDGRRDSLFLPAYDARELLADIARRAPQAHIGYDPAVEQRVRALRR